MASIEEEEGKPIGCRTMESSKEDEECHDPKDIWGSNVGYTPLIDLRQSTATIVTDGELFAVGPHLRDDDDVANAEDPHDFVEFAGGGEEHIEGESEETGKAGQLDFRAIADQALFALDNDYRMTVNAASTTTGSEAALRQVDAGDSCPSLPKDHTLNLPPIRLTTEEFGDAFFVTDFGDSDWPENPGPADARPLPHVDVEAVKRAVQAIHLRDPTLKSHLEEWESQQRCLLGLAPRLHPVIPSAPLSAFGKATPRAKAATARLTRAATIAEALHRLDLLQSQECFTIDLLGCDGVECGSEALVRQHFEPLARWIGAYSESPRHLELRLVGPNVPPSAPSSSVALVCSRDDDGAGSRLQSANATCATGLYHEWCQQVPDPHPHGNDQSASLPHLRVAFHAGIWGYSEWRETLEWLAAREDDHGTPLVVTAYTLEEAQDDADALEGILEALWDRTRVEAATLWRAEANGFASRVDRETATAPPGRQYRENAAWSCFRI